MYKVYLLSINLLWLSITLSPSQSNPFVEYPDKTSKYLKRIQNGKAKYKYNTNNNFKQWQAEARKELSKIIGLDKISKELQGFKPSVIKIKEATIDDKYIRTLYHIETEPGIKVPFYRLVPKNRLPIDKLPLLLSPHGHDLNGFHSYAGAYINKAHRDKIIGRKGNIAEQAVLKGMIAIAPATRGLAKETLVPDPKGRHGNRPCRAQLMHCLISGRTPTAERVWDMQKLLDWALADTRIDQEKIIMTGNSGGGVLTAYTSALDERIKISLPSCSFTSITSTNGYIFHCDCCAIPSIKEWGDFSELGGLIAPRRLLIVHGIKDGLHNKIDVERTSNAIKAIYSDLKISDRMSMTWGNSGHQFYPKIMWPFIEKALRQ